MLIEGYRLIQMNTVANFKKDELNDYPNDIDLLICADVLEHTKEPLKVLRKLLKNCTNDVEVVISLPNN